MNLVSGFISSALGFVTRSFQLINPFRAVAPETISVTRVAQQVLTVTAIPLDVSKLIAQYAVLSDYPSWRDQGLDASGFAQFILSLESSHRPAQFARFISTEDFTEDVLVSFDFRCALSHLTGTDPAKIPPEVYGGSFEEVCRWLPTNLKKLDLSDWCSYVTDDCMRAVAESCPNLEELQIPSCRQLTLTGVEVVAQRCEKLRTLNITVGPVYTYGEYAAFKAKYPHITDLWI